MARHRAVPVLITHDNNRSMLTRVRLRILPGLFGGIGLLRLWLLIIGRPTSTTAGERDADRGLEQARIGRVDARERRGKGGDGRSILPRCRPEELIAIGGEPPAAPEMDQCAQTLRRTVERQTLA